MKLLSVLIVGGIMLATSGCATPIRSRNHITMDKAYYSLTQKQFDHARGHAVTKMKDDGWNEYKKESLDCDDYAFKMMSEIRFALNSHYDSDRGWSVGFASYLIDDEDNNGDGIINEEEGDVDHGWHACIFVDIYVADDKPNVRKYYQPYPWSKTTPIEMSETELKSIRRTIK